MFGLTTLKRKRLKRRPFPSGWTRILERGMPYFPALSPADREELKGHVQVFLHEKRFEGCRGLEVDEAMRVLTAAHACLLLLHRRTDYFPSLGSILIYPDSFITDVARTLPDGTVLESTEHRLGESWHRGSVVLSWRDVKRDAAHPEWGRNLVLHEFAHQLDSESGAVDGLPVLPRRSLYRAWAVVMGQEFERLGRDLERGRRTLLDPYAATSPAEFFAVVTETFFLRPHALKARHHRLYGLFQTYYRQNPCTRERLRPDWAEEEL